MLELNINPIHYKGNNCIEDQFSSLAHWLGRDYLLAFKDCWNFEFNYKAAQAANVILGDKISGGYNYDKLLRSCGLEIILEKVKNVQAELELIKRELNKGLPVVHLISAHNCPWDVRFNTPGGDHREYHALLIVDIINNKTLKCTDGWYAKKSENLSMPYFIKGFTSYCYTFNILNYSANEINIKTALLNAANIIKLQISSLRRFAVQIDKSLDIRLETASVNGDIANSSLFKGLTHILDGRIKFSVFLERFENNSFVEKFSKEFYKCIIRWETIRGMFVKASFLDDISKLKSNIALKIEEVADYEESLADYIINNIDTDWDSFDNVGICSSYENKSDAAELSEILFIDLNQFFNNNGIGSFPTDHDVKLISTGQYFVSQDLPDKIIHIENMKFKFPEVHDELKDNICCNGQYIEVMENNYSCIMLLGCSEWGHFIENFQIIYSDGDIESLQVGFSDWGSPLPVFDEKIVWEGKVASKDNFDSNLRCRLFGKSYKLNKNKKAISIKLPYCLDMHIFSISLGL